MLAIVQTTVLAALGVLPACPWQATEDQVDFATQMRPILQARCMECHGAQKQKAGLRLDSRSAPMAGAWGGEEQVILPGDGAAGTPGRRVMGLDEVEDRMSVHDLHATLLHQLGIDRERLTDRLHGRLLRPSDGAGVGQEDLLA